MQYLGLILLALLSAFYYNYGDNSMAVIEEYVQTITDLIVPKKTIFCPSE